ncbi:MAG: LysM peptidoglycan-binding domain-containing protein, partial [Candidatus Promineifilaceae bacterium]
PRALATGLPALPPTPQIFPSPTGPVAPVSAPTPNPVPAQGPAGSHIVAAGDTLGLLALRYGTTVEALISLNGLADGDVLSPGQVLQVPAETHAVGPSFKVIPDSELVYGPAAAGFDVAAEVSRHGGALSSYQEVVEGQALSGAAVVQLVANRYSVNPRLLLAVLEYKSGWLTQPGPADAPYPLGYHQAGWEGLYLQLGWAANLLNLGYYGRAEGGLRHLQIGAGERMAFAAEINDGTAGVQALFAGYPDASYARWLDEVGQNGLYATFSRLFGSPFAYSVEPLWPAGLAQPPLALPWAPGETWFFTGGPHGGWAGGSAWAALDFAPPEDQLGCYISDTWATAMVGGVVTRSDHGAVVIDLDGDSFAGTGWAITYMHLEGRGRVAAGTHVETGARLGHPSCEGGYSNGTHLHVSRTYNGRWLAADGALPFVMGGWTSQGLGREYDGLMVRGEEVREAYEGRLEINAIPAG